MKDITYSFIIPHKNSPELLQRCVNSIPRRDDIQIIVVDDNSDKVNWDTFRFDNDKCIELIKTTEGKGAGYARNIGLQNAVGKWCLFIDCDDFYTKNFLDVLDKYKDSKIDVLYFNSKGVYSDTMRPYYRYCRPQRITNNYDQTKETLDAVKYSLTIPWNKMVNAEFIRKNNIHFEEISKSNDMFFSLKAGYMADNVEVIKDILYFYTFQQESITNKKQTKDTFITLLQNLYKFNGFVEYLGYPQFRWSLIKKFVSTLLDKGFLQFFLILRVYVFNYSELKKYKTKYIKDIVG